MCFPSSEPTPGTCQNPIRRKLVIVGDGGVGKTALVRCFVMNELALDGQYIATIFENHVIDVKCGSKNVELTIWDTAGQEDFDRIRYLAYPDTDAVVICFSVDDPQSLENVLELWVPEVQTYCRGLPYLLVGCKSDLRADAKLIQQLAEKNESPIMYRKGFEIAQQIGACGYVETSARLGLNVEAAFLQAVQAVLPKKKRCVIL
ncbi:hypothetical protein DM01DRAFT_1382597 [Hesseltinella vesiculosa]|uniref:Uncharacterized protein n=1 Tax=Hesseltinella vesiculosa TaxID=101127 RepID=A0A1X2GME5_9FUNG|nr:hypothetical protein DM01DRAFT_1382597 [Hesseltinella vesiculosa]